MVKFGGEIGTLYQIFTPCTPLHQTLPVINFYLHHSAISSHISQLFFSGKAATITSPRDPMVICPILLHTKYCPEVLPLSSPLSPDTMACLPWCLPWFPPWYPPWFPTPPHHDLSQSSLATGLRSRPALCPRDSSPPSMNLQGTKCPPSCDSGLAWPGLG